MNHVEPPELVPQGDNTSHARLPEWARPIVGASAFIFPYFLAIGALLLVVVVLTLGFTGAKRIDLGWAKSLVNFMVLLFSLGCLSLLIGKVRNVIASWIVLGVGIALYFSPLLFGYLALQVGIKEAEKVVKGAAKTVDPLLGKDPYAIVQHLSGQFHSLGIFLIILAGISLVVAYVLLVITRENQKRQVRLQYIDPEAKRTEKPSIIPTCWQMSRCRPSVRITCPNYIDHVTCWKRRRGCFCDRELASFLIDNVGRGEAQEVMDMQKRTGLAQSVGKMRGHMTDKGKRPSWKVQKFRCHNCPLFIEHQEYKYRNFSWSSFFVTVAIAGGSWPLFDLGYKAGARELSELLTRYNHILHTNVDLANSAFEYVLFAVLFLLLWTYVIELMDRVFLVWKL